MNYDEWKLASPPESTDVTRCCQSYEYEEGVFNEEEDCYQTICEDCGEPCEVVSVYDL